MGIHGGWWLVVVLLLVVVLPLTENYKSTLLHWKGRYFVASLVVYFVES
jgi:hypothetical protein